MLNALLPLLESLGSEGGTATSLGRGSGIGSTIGRLLGGSQVQAFGNQNELGGAMRQISDLTASLAAAREAMTSMRDEHEQLGVKAAEDERLYGFRDPAEAQRMADLQRQQIENARQSQIQQQQMQDLQARAAVTMDPRLAAQEQRRARFGRAGAIEIGGQLAIQGARSAASWAYQPLGEAASFLGGPAGNIANQMAGQASGSISSVASSATHGASLGMAVGGPVGAAVGGVAGGAAQAVVEIAKLPNKIKDWSEALVESQRHLGRFSGVLAGAYAQRDVRNLQRDIMSAQTTGGSTADLSGTLNELYDVIRPLKDEITIVLAAELKSGVRMLTEVVPLITSIVPKIAAVIDFYTLFAFNLTGEIKKAREAVEKAEKDRKANGASASKGLAGEIGRALGTDPLRPPSIPRR